jgi:hypothetical protein
VCDSAGCRGGPGVGRGAGPYRRALVAARACWWARDRPPPTPPDRRPEYRRRGPTQSQPRPWAHDRRSARGGPRGGPHGGSVGCLSFTGAPRGGPWGWGLLRLLCGLLVAPAVLCRPSVTRHARCAMCCLLPVSPSVCIPDSCLGSGSCSWNFEQRRGLYRAGAS